MAISVIGAASASTTIYQPIDSAGTYTLSTPITAGAYAITGDSTQTLTFTLVNALGYRFDFVMRGGRGRVYVPATAASIIAPAGTYPITLGFEKMVLTLPSTPTATFAWNANPSGNATGKFTFTAPSGTTSTRIYWEDGTNETLTSGADITIKPFVNAGGITRSPLIIHKNAIGLESAGQVLTTANSLPNANVVALTSSGTWTVPTAVTSVDVLVVAGAGSGGSGGNSAGAGGGGGAGGLLISTGVAVTPGAGIAYTIGAGGLGVSQPGNNGGNSVFGAITATGGGRGGGAAYGGVPNAGGSGGGSAGGGNNSPGGAATAGQGNAGGAHTTTNYDGGAGGGGFGAAGVSKGVYDNNGSAGGAGYNLSSFSASLSGFVAAGGGGGAQSATGGAAGSVGAGRGADNNQANMSSGSANTGSGGGGGGNGSNPAGGNGGSGVIYVKYLV